jgi:hypothetical protein
MVEYEQFEFPSPILAEFRRIWPKFDPWLIFSTPIRRKFGRFFTNFGHFGGKQNYCEKTKSKNVATPKKEP